MFMCLCFLLVDVLSNRMMGLHLQSAPYPDMFSDLLGGKDQFHQVQQQPQQSRTQQQVCEIFPSPYLDHLFLEKKVQVL